MALTREQLDTQKCSCCDVPALEHPLEITQKCHPEAGLTAFYFGGVIEIFCKTCGKFIVDVQVHSE